ncbi:MAG: hypothetical protein RLZZ196_3741 [Bacteroidota bacterium]|jgi:hypothetical protein
MKVKELIEILLTFDPNLDIVIQGYEGGVTEKISVESAQIVCDINDEWYYGEHEVDSDYHQEINPNNSRKKVLYISR